MAEGVGFSRAGSRTDYLAAPGSLDGLRLRSDESGLRGCALGAGSYGLVPLQADNGSADGMARNRGAASRSGAARTSPRSATMSIDMSRFTPSTRAAWCVIREEFFNNSGTLLCGTDDIESSVLLSGEVYEGQ